jgi:hypothetical protein
MSVPISPTPQVSTNSANPPSAAPPRVNLSDIFTRFRNYGEHVAYIIMLMFAFGLICANVLSFVRPGSYIIKELDILFPDDTTSAPYNFDAERGMVDSNETAVNAVAAAAAAAEKAEANKDKSWLAKLIIEMVSSPWPYSSLAVNINDVKTDDLKTTRSEVLAPGKISTVFGVLVKELIGNSLYFSYGNGRYLLKKFFKRIALFMANKTLVPPGQQRAEIKDDSENIPYITNLMCFAVPIIISFLSFVVIMGWGPITTIMGSIANITYKRVSVEGHGEGAEPTYEKIWSFKKGLSGFLMLLVIGAFTILPIAISSYTIQPFMLFVILLLYPIASNFKKFTEIFLEIVPMLMLGFVICSIMAAFYDLDERVAIFLAIFMSLAYFKIFSEKIDGIRSVIAQFMAGTLVFGDHSVPAAAAAAAVAEKSA